MIFNPRAAVYVRVFPDRFIVRHIESGQETTVDSEPTFTTKRLLIGEFVPAATALRTAFRRVLPKSLLPLETTAVIHQTTMTEGGLFAVEERVLLEVASQAGAKRVVAWVGADLQDSDVREKARAA
jgi:hypothetical protein